jgi:hypothetical protein
LSADWQFGAPAFPESLGPHQIAVIVAVRDRRSEIPDFVIPAVRALIQDCWEADPDDRPTFEEIMDRLAEMEFKVTADVNSVKVVGFVKGIEKRI